MTLLSSAAALFSGQAPIGRPATPLAHAAEEAERLLALAVRAGRQVPPTVSGPILAMALPHPAVVPAGDRQAFYLAYGELARLAGSLNKQPRDQITYPFEEALEDAEQLLKFAAESAKDVSPETAKPVLAARTRLKANTLDDDVRSEFYCAYARLAKLFGDVTAETIRNCSSPETKSSLRRNRVRALVFTLVVAVASTVMFVADSSSQRILADIALGDSLAVKLRLYLTTGQFAIDPRYVDHDPCGLLSSAPLDHDVQALTDGQIYDLQTFAGTIRDLYGRTLKLDGMLDLFHYGECDPFLDSCRKPASQEQADATHRGMQILPAIRNFTAESLCKIQTYQKARAFGNDVHSDYSAAVGAFLASGLPILYALLGAYAYRLRLFADTVLRRTYHPSFSDSARMITAIIAGAISGTINPARDLALSPLATAFLIGYGVELFFRFLDTLIGSFGGSAKKPS